MKSNLNIADTTAFDLDLLFFDTEATGLMPSHELIEIGFLKVRRSDLSVLHQENIKVQPLQISKADPVSMEYNHYSPQAWKDALHPKAALQRFLQFSEGCMLVGHNLAFDWAQLWKYIDRYGLQANFYYKGLDVFSFALAKLGKNPQLKYYSLSEFAQYFGIEREKKHEALADAYTTYLVYKALQGV
ncbi:MAG: 3'-5' exonuclease [Candidatus Harrisonbacteria bacterium]|nr:3'-5' exonuclease [Candidatus Harrisonbacteria bacterium]